MKKIITLMSVLLLFLMTSFASADSLVKTVQLTDPTELTGTITYLDLEGGQYLLQNERGKYALLGQNEKVRNSLGKKVHVTGRIVDLEVTYYQRGNGFFQINTLEVLGEGDEYIYPETPAVKEPVEKAPVVTEPIPQQPVQKPELGNPTQLEGKLVLNFIEGKHYELVTKKGAFVLTGNTSGLEKYIDYNIVAKGAFTVGAITIWQKGEVFVVDQWSLQENPVTLSSMNAPKEVKVAPVTVIEPAIKESTTEEKAPVSSVAPKEAVKETPKEAVQVKLPEKKKVSRIPVTPPKKNLPTIPKPPVEKMSAPVKTEVTSKEIQPATPITYFSFSKLNGSHFSIKNYEPVQFSIK